MALKMIDRKKIEGENEDMVEYLQGEIDCMKEMNCPHLVKLYDFEKDEDNYYMLMEYCDGGDLINQQITFKNKVFPLETTIEYLS